MYLCRAFRPGFGRRWRHSTNGLTHTWANAGPICDMKGLSNNKDQYIKDGIPCDQNYVKLNLLLAKARGFDETLSRKCFDLYDDYRALTKQVCVCVLIRLVVT